MIPNIDQLRKDYQREQLDINDVRENPIQQFKLWFEEALQTDVLEANAMTLATATADGTPAARIVLLKGFDEDGFVFYTNYNSRKGDELKENPRVTLLFFWRELERQVRIEGLIDKTTERASTEYFQSRPKDSQVAAWASPQSQKLESREVLEQKFAAIAEQYQTDDQLPKPAHWGGYVVKPYKIEFWQGRANRMHDRILYTLSELTPAKKWTIERLAP